MTAINFPPDWNDQGDKSWLAPDDPRRYIGGGRRCALTMSGWLNEWWMGTSPRNGDGATVEGSWEDWVALACGILRAHVAAVESGLCEPIAGIKMFTEHADEAIAVTWEQP